MQSNLEELQNSILRTLCYADIFDYPLTSAEIHNYLINKKKASVTSVHSALSVLQAKHEAGEKDGHYFLKNREKIVNKRLKRKNLSKKKTKIARRVGKWLKKIPSVRAVAITGALAMKNSDEFDDIDLMIITAKNRLWLTRLLVVSVISLIFKRRVPPKNHQKENGKWRKESEKYENAICLNLWLDESALSVPKNQRNLYTAHEVAQVKFLWSRYDIEQKLLAQNYWVKSYLPNTKLSKMKNSENRKQKSPLFIIHNSLFTTLEFLAFRFQLFYMRNKRTTEKISAHLAFFHPRNTSQLILVKYKERLRKRGVIQ